jgi:hypothetical protein
MQSVYRLKANELNDRFLKSLKTFWGDDLRSVEDHREIEVAKPPISWPPKPSIEIFSRALKILIRGEIL